MYVYQENQRSIFGQIENCCSSQVTAHQACSIKVLGADRPAG